MSRRIRTCPPIDPPSIYTDINHHASFRSSGCTTRRATRMPRATAARRSRSSSPSSSCARPWHAWWRGDEASPRHRRLNAGRRPRSNRACPRLSSGRGGAPSAACGGRAAAQDTTRWGRRSRQQAHHHHHHHHHCRSSRLQERRTGSQWGGCNRPRERWETGGKTRWMDGMDAKINVYLECSQRRSNNFDFIFCPSVPFRALLLPFPPFSLSATCPLFRAFTAAPPTPPAQLSIRCIDHSLHYWLPTEPCSTLFGPARQAPIRTFTVCLTRLLNRALSPFPAQAE